MLSTGMAQELRILNWNTYLLPKGLSQTFQDERAGLIADYILGSEMDFDVLTFQEVFSASALEILGERLAGKYPFHSGRPDQKWWKPANSGLIIFSRYPITERSFCMFTRSRDTDFLSAKGVLVVGIEREGKPLVRIATTHMQAHRHHQSVRIRKHQYGQISRSIVNNFGNREVPLIITGDFNIDMYNHSEFGPFLEAMAFLRPEISGSFGFSYDTELNSLAKKSNPRELHQSLLDYIFLITGSGDQAVMLETRILDPRGIYGRKAGVAGSLSDHFPVYSVIRFGTGVLKQEE